MATSKTPRAASTPHASELERLTTAECWRLLQDGELGRLAVTREDGAPDIFPLNYLAYEGALYIRTARDAKLLHIAHHPDVAFEVDGEAGVHWWSVVVHGIAERVTSDAELRASGVARLLTASPTTKSFAVRISARAVTGRRFVRASAVAGRAHAFEASAARPAAPAADAQERWTRPIPIPHHPPPHV